MKKSIKKKNKNLQISIKNTTFQRNISSEPAWKKVLKGKLRSLLNNNIILNEDKFSPLSFTESISPKFIKEYKSKFHPLDDRYKINIYTSVNPCVLNSEDKFYTRYFDHVFSPDELLAKNFTEKEIYAIKNDPFYFQFGSDYNNVEFFKKKTLTDTLNEEAKIGRKEMIKHDLKESLKKTHKKIEGYLDYYTYVMSQKDFIPDRRYKIKKKKDKYHEGNSSSESNEE